MVLCTMVVLIPGLGTVHEVEVMSPVTLQNSTVVIVSYKVQMVNSVMIAIRVMAMGVPVAVFMKYQPVH